MSIPSFKDIVNTELKPFDYEAFHITIKYEECINYFLQKQIHKKSST